MTAAGMASNSQISNSPSIVAIPIYDSSAGPLNPTGTTAVTVVGFLQVFINSAAQRPPEK